MAFLIFTKENRKDGLHYCKTDEGFRLAGRNLIYHSWLNRGKPLNTGWTLTSRELLTLRNEAFRPETHGLIIDFDPYADWRIGLLELDRIHLYTFGDKGTDKAFWTPMMLELRQIYYNEDFDELTAEKKQEMLCSIPCHEEPEEIVEFLYLNGDDKAWNWGKNGMTNAAFVHAESRRYFKQFF